MTRIKTFLKDWRKTSPGTFGALCYVFIALLIWIIVVKIRYDLYTVAGGFLIWLFSCLIAAYIGLMVDSEHYDREWRENMKKLEDEYWK